MMIPTHRLKGFPIPLNPEKQCDDTGDKLEKVGNVTNKAFQVSVPTFGR